MTGDEWLAEVFRAALGSEAIGFGGDADNLRGQVRALHDCGVLSDEACDAAERDLDAAVAGSLERRRLKMREVSATPPAAPPAATFRRVMAVGEPLADVEGMPLLVTSVESWSDRVEMFLAAVPNAEAELEIAEFGKALESWHRWRVERRSGPGVMNPPGLRGENLHSLDIRLRDDLGTTYQHRGGSAGGGGTEWRAHRTYRPGIPATATTLTIEAVDESGHSVGTITLPL
jgi:hypothetical protein